jgi:micrococcal nuclease
LSEGLAWHYKDYSTSSEYSKLEENARAQKKGLFRQKDPIPPWEWRKQQKKEKNLKAIK